jgi:hypothetical protein
MSKMESGGRYMSDGASVRKMLRLLQVYNKNLKYIKDFKQIAGFFFQNNASDFQQNVQGEAFNFKKIIRLAFFILFYFIIKCAFSHIPQSLEQLDGIMPFDSILSP